MEQKRFTKNDNSFICINCGKKVKPLSYTSRDHCPFCLTSLHVDIMPGDRQNPCQGFLKPISIKKYRDTYKIEYKCQKCNAKIFNIMASDDDMDKIIEISSSIGNL